MRYVVANTLQKMAFLKSPTYNQYVKCDGETRRVDLQMI